MHNTLLKGMIAVVDSYKIAGCDLLISINHDGR